MIPQLTLSQALRIVWFRKWLILSIFALVAGAGSAYVLTRPKQYTATATLVVESRPDPVLGGLALPLSMSTELEVLRSDKVAARVVEELGLHRDPETVEEWMKETQGKIPIERHLATFVQRSMKVEPVRGSNVLSVEFRHPDPAMAAAGANAIARTAMDVSLEMRVEPARQSASWFEEQARALRRDLEEAQAKLSDFQREKGILVTDERLDEENQRLNTLSTELAQAQAERLEAAARARQGGESAPDVLANITVQSLRGQLGAAENRLVEMSRNLGPAHPQRIQLEAQIAELRQQLAAEIRRVSGSASAVSRASSQKVEQLQALLEAQKKRLLELNSARDAAAILRRDVETARRAYEMVTQRGSQVSLESQTNQSILRLLSPAIEPLNASTKRVVVGVLASLMAGGMLSLLLAFGLEFKDRRVRGEGDLLDVDGISLIAVVGEGAERFRTTGPWPRPALPYSGAS